MGRLDGPCALHDGRQREFRELLGHTLCDELCFSFCVLDLEDVQLNLLAGQLLELGSGCDRLRRRGGR